MKQSIIVSLRAPNDLVLLEMTQDNENERYHVRTYASVDEAIARYEELYEQIHGRQESAKMGDEYKLDPRIQIVDGEDVSVLVKDDIVDMDNFRVLGFQSQFGTMVGASATGPKALEWHEQGIKPGLVMI